jgi:hypothetical protein
MDAYRLPWSLTVANMLQARASDVVLLVDGYIQAQSTLITHPQVRDSRLLPRMPSLQHFLVLFYSNNGNGAGMMVPPHQGSIAACLELHLVTKVLFAGGLHTCLVQGEPCWRKVHVMHVICS